MEGTFVHRKTGFGGQNNKDKAVVHGKGAWGGQSASKRTHVHRMLHFCGHVSVWRRISQPHGSPKWIMDYLFSFSHASMFLL